MKLDRQIRRIFGLEKSSGPSLKHPVAEEETTLAYAGYPMLRQADLFLTLPVLERWRAERTLSFPPGCCVCSRAARQYLPAYAEPGWLGFLRREQVLTRIPHCEDHGRGGEARLLVLVNSWSELVCQLSLIGLNEVFLLETRDLNQAGDMPPPWRAFPGYEPASSGWRQGNGEYWFLHAWSPFWKRLPEEEREQYLRRWDAPTEWRAWMVDSV